MLRAYDYRNSVRLNGFEDRVGKLSGKALLKLRPSRQDIQRPSQLANTDDAAAGKVAYACGAVQGEKVMLAYGEKWQVLSDYQLPMLLFEARRERFRRVLGHPGEELRVHLGDPLGGLSQSFSTGVLADCLEDCLNRLF